MYVQKANLDKEHQPPQVKENNATSDPEINPDKINKIANNITSELN